MAPCKAAPPDAGGAGMSGARDMRHAPPPARPEEEGLATLVAARICHDLVSPLGAIGNGVELMQMACAAESAEIGLISDSVSAATARLRLFRIAFGAAQPGAVMGRAEIAAILDGLAPAARCLVNWRVREELPRDEVRLALLLLMCLESTLPHGGGITFDRWPCEPGAAGGTAGGWAIRAEAERMAPDPVLWAVARGAPLPQDLPPRHVHFALVPGALAALGRRLTLVEAAQMLDVRA